MSERTNEPEEPPGCVSRRLMGASQEDAKKIYELLEFVRNSVVGSLLERDEETVQRNIGNFMIIKDGEKIIACGEIFQTENTFTIELGALATDPKYQGQGCSDMIIDYAEALAKKERKYLILVSNNDGLEKKLINRGYQLSSIRYAWRQESSPEKRIYVKIIP